MILSFNNLLKSFSHKPVLNNISCEVQSGEIVGLIGKNGIGKSTLLRILSGLSSADSGEIRVNDQILNSNNWRARREFLYIGHAPGLYQAFSAVENLMFAADLYKVENSAEKVVSFLDKVGLSEQKGDAIKVYSQGMTQRLKIALAMLVPWDILLFDEPFSGLDSQGIALIEMVMNKWKEERKTMLIVDHDLEWILKFCTRVLLLDGGSIVLDSITDDAGTENVKDTFRKLVG